MAHSVFGTLFLYRFPTPLKRILEELQIDWEFLIILLSQLKQILDKSSISLSIQGKSR